MGLRQDGRPSGLDSHSERDGGRAEGQKVSQTLQDSATTPLVDPQEEEHRGASPVMGQGV